MINNPFLYQYPVPPPPPYPHPVSKGVLGGVLASEYKANRGFWRRPLWQSEFGPGHQCRPEATEASSKHWTVAAFGGTTSGAAAVS